MQQPTTPSYAIDVQVDPHFLADQSEPDAGRYVFAYTIRLHNRGSVAARLLARHWSITDGNGHTEEVHGDGVVGEQPWLEPGEDYQYTSGVVLETGDGAMQGRYDMLAADGTRFDAPIAPFLLTVPRTLH
jgi:ApaG protein